MTLWIDADAAPREVKDICIRACDRTQIRVQGWLRSAGQSSRGIIADLSPGGSSASWS